MKLFNHTVTNLFFVESKLNFVDLSFMFTFHLNGNGLISRMDNQNSLTMIAGGMVYNSVICLLWFPGGLANIGKTAGDWVFLHADLVALFISMAVLVAGMTVGPTFWKRWRSLQGKPWVLQLLLWL